MKQAMRLIFLFVLTLYVCVIQISEAHAKVMQKLREQNTLETLNQNPGAIYLSDFKNPEDAMRAWENYKTHIPILYLFHPFAMSSPSSENAVSLIAMISQIDIPSSASYKILNDTCKSLVSQGYECSPFQFELNVSSLQLKQSLNKNNNIVDQGINFDNSSPALNVTMPPTTLYDADKEGGIEKSVHEKEDYLERDSNITDDTISQAAMRAAYDLVRNRYESAIYQAQIDGEGSLYFDSQDGLALTKDALSSAAERAFEKFLQENYGKRNLGGRTYDGLKGYFISSFKHAAATSIRSVGRRFVQDVTSGGDFKALSMRSEILDGLDKNFATAFIDTGLAAAKNSQYAFLRNLEVSYKIREEMKPEYSILTLQPLYSSEKKKHNMFAQASFSNEGSRKSVSGGLGYRYLPESKDYVVGANLFFDYEHPFGHQRASAGLDFQTSLWGVSTNYYKGLTEWRKANAGFEERSLDGQDIELTGRMPFLPALQVSGRAYLWQAFEGGEDIKGQELQLEYSPVPAFTIEALLNDEEGRNAEFGMALRYNYVFGAPDEYLYDWDEQFRQKSASEYIFNKVRRENTIRVQERIDTGFAAANAIAPGLLAATPTDGSTGLSIGIDVTLMFDADVLAGAGNIVFTDLTDGSGDFSIPVGDARVTIVNDTVTIDLSAQLFEFNTNYDITMGSGVFTDTVGTPFGGLSSGDLDFTTVVDPTAGFPAATVSMAPGSTSTSHENAQDVGTWETIIDIGGAPDGVIFESGATGQGIAASFGGGNLVFAAGDGASTSTGTDSIFGTYPIASIPQGLHHFTFVADPDAPSEIGMYLDGIRVINESIAGGMQGGEWAGTNGAGYGLVNSAIRAGVDTSAISGATLISNLDFYTNVAPADF